MDILIALKEIVGVLSGISFPLSSITYGGQVDPPQGPADSVANVCSHQRGSCAAGNQWKS